MMNEVKYINKDLVEKHLKTKVCIDLMKVVLKDYSEKSNTQTLRNVFKLNDTNLLGLMPGYVKKDKCFGTKVITVFPNNYINGKPSHQGIVLLFDDRDGSLKAMVDGEAITSKRTASVSAAATDLLANPQAHQMTLMGAGVQAEMHLESISHVRSLTEVKIWCPHIKESQVFVKRMQKKYPFKLTAVEDPKLAVMDADIICTITSSKLPILFADWLKEGVHINAVGACAPDARELDTSVVVKSRVFVDSYESAMSESGDLLMPIQEGAWEASLISGEIGEVLLGLKKGRISQDEITVFESLGLAVEDIAAANYVYNQLKF